MGFDPHVHHRHSIRLRSWDYATAGASFVTICVADRAYVFGTVEDGQMRPNGLGNLVAEYWRTLPQHFPTIGLDRIRCDAKPRAFHRVVEPAR